VWSHVASAKETATRLWEAVKSLSVSSQDRVPIVPDHQQDEECVELYVWLR
jgi:hypothetical protein